MYAMHKIHDGNVCGRPMQLSVDLDQDICMTSKICIRAIVCGRPMQLSVDLDQNICMTSKICIRAIN
jgi:uncharacterized Fe-S cluster protein YjdI